MDSKSHALEGGHWGRSGTASSPLTSTGRDVSRPPPPSPRARPSVYGKLRLEDSRRCSRLRCSNCLHGVPRGTYSEQVRGWAGGNDGARVHPDGPLDKAGPDVLQTCCVGLLLCSQPASPPALCSGAWTPRAPLTSLHPDLDATALEQGQPRLEDGQTGCSSGPRCQAGPPRVRHPGVRMLRVTEQGVTWPWTPTLVPCPLPLHPHASPQTSPVSLASSGSTGKGVS